MKYVDPYEKLAHAIIVRAANDYRRLWNFKRTDYAKHELIKFFRSEWFSILTKLNPEWLIEELEKEADAKRKKVNRSTKALSVGRKALARRS
jgi:hypothetical protein